MIFLFLFWFLSPFSFFIISSAFLPSHPGIKRLNNSQSLLILSKLQYSWASLVAQTVKNLPAVWETWVLSLGWEDPVEEGMATHSSILAWRISTERGTWRATVHGVAKSQTQLCD